MFAIYHLRIWHAFVVLHTQSSFVTPYIYITRVRLSPFAPTLLLYEYAVKVLIQVETPEQAKRLVAEGHVVVGGKTYKVVQRTRRGEKKTPGGEKMGGAGTVGKIEEKTEEKTQKADSGQGNTRTGVRKSGGRRGGGGVEGGCREGGEREDGGASDALARAISARLHHLRATRRTGGNTDNGHASSDDFSNDAALPPPGPGSIVVSNDRWCVYPPALGKPNRKTDNPPVHLDICPWTYVSTDFFSY